MITIHVGLWIIRLILSLYDWIHWVVIGAQGGMGEWLIMTIKIHSIPPFPTKHQ